MNSPTSPNDDERLELGTHRICPTCKGKGTNPAHPKEPCIRCGGRKVVKRG